MIGFQFDGEVDYFELDPVAYAPAPRDNGLRDYRARLDAIRARLGQPPPAAERWAVPDRDERFVLDWNDQRLAVLDRDIDAIIRTHARYRKVAAWFEDTAKAFEEIGEIDLANDWARRATAIRISKDSPSSAVSRSIERCIPAAPASASAASLTARPSGSMTTGSVRP